MHVPRIGRHEQVPDTGSFGLSFHFLDNRNDFPTLTFMFLAHKFGMVGAHILLDKIAHAVAPIALPFGEGEIHVSRPFLIVRLIFRLWAELCHASIDFFAGGKLA